MKFTLYRLFSWHKFMMNDTFSIKKCSQHCFHLRFLHSHILSFWFLWTQPSCTLTFCFWIVHETPTFIIHYNLFKTFLSSSIISTNWTDVAAHWCFWSSINKWGPNKHTLFSFLNLRLISYILFLYWSLSFLLTSKHSKVWSSAKHFWMTSVGSSILEVEGWPFCLSSYSNSRPSLNLYAT
jgi:hypothetical protein